MLGVRLDRLGRASILMSSVRDAEVVGKGVAVNDPDSQRRSSINSQ
jgi:hypothetical protein